MFISVGQMEKKNELLGLGFEPYNFLNTLQALELGL